MKILENVDLNKKTTMRAGGKAHFFVSVESVDDLKEAVAFAKEKNIPFFILGGGSNVLISDDGFSGLVIEIKIKGIEYDGKEVSVGAGENWDEFVSDTLKHDLYGLENLSYIPGTVGASPIQNIGAYGREVSEFIKTVHALNTETLEEEVFSNKDCQFSYRDSFFKKENGKKYIITQVDFELFTSPSINTSYNDLKEYFGSKEVSPREVREVVIEIRKRKLPDPKNIGTVGSFFKNPIIRRDHILKLKEEYPDMPSFDIDEKRVKVLLAWVLDKILDLKGYQVGDVRVHDSQPLAITNVGNATTEEIKKVADEITKKVFEKTKIKIEYEVREV